MQFSQAKFMEMRELIDQISRMTTTDEADGIDMSNDQAMNGLIRRARMIVDKPIPVDRYGKRTDKWNMQPGCI